jgi:hypothetical protein
MSANIDKFDARYKPENTAHIFGIEKPVLSENSDGIYFHFLDHAMDMLIVNPELGTKEPFYWTADFPILPMEQAYQTALNVAIDKKFKNCLINKDDQNSALRVNRLLKLQNKLFKDILYRDSWNPSTFQVGKPNVDRSDWYYWMYEMSDFAEARDVYSSTVKSIQSDIDTSLLLEKTNYNAGLRKLKTKGFKILDFVQ